MDGAKLIAAERARQKIEEGYEVADDVARQRDQQLAVAAWCYVGDYVNDGDPHPLEEEPAEWPWPAGTNGCWWKPTPDDPVRQLVKAGALIAAEIDRVAADGISVRVPSSRPAAMSTPVHVVLGMTGQEWDDAMAVGRATPGWKGIPATQEPRYHSHPALGIIGHSHGRVADARRPHVHHPEVGWDYTPVFVPHANE